MEVIKTKLDGVYIIKNNIFKDERGMFIKTYHYDLFKERDLCTDFKESYYSVSRKNTIRGMHFQKPPFDHDKLVYVANGKILDVIVDLRKNSKTFKEFISVEISRENGYSVYIPKGCAHGFLALEDDTITVYNVSTVYNAKYDSGISYDSFGMNWNIKNPIISDRDRGFYGIDELNEYF